MPTSYVWQSCKKGNIGNEFSNGFDGGLDMGRMNELKDRLAINVQAEHTEKTELLKTTGGG